MTSNLHSEFECGSVVCAEQEAESGAGCSHAGATVELKCIPAAINQRDV